MLASGINPHMAGFNQSPHFVEKKVTEWLRELMKFPESSSGMLLSGASMANLTALTVARYFAMYYLKKFCFNCYCCALCVSAFFLN